MSTQSGHTVARRRTSLHSMTEVQIVALEQENQYNGNCMYKFLIEDGRLKAVHRGIETVVAGNYYRSPSPTCRGEIPPEIQKRVVEVVEADSWEELAVDWGDDR